MGRLGIYETTYINLGSQGKETDFVVRIKILFVDNAPLTSELSTCNVVMHLADLVICVGFNMWMGNTIIQFVQSRYIDR